MEMSTPQGRQCCSVDAWGRHHDGVEAVWKGWHQRTDERWTVALRSLFSKPAERASVKVRASDYIWAKEPAHTTADDEHVVVMIRMPGEPFEHVNVRKIGHLLHVEVSQQQVDTAEPADPYARLVARREPRTPLVLRRAIPLELVTEEPAWNVTEDNRLRIEMRLHGASGAHRDRVVGVALPQSGPPPARAPKRDAG